MREIKFRGQCVQSKEWVFGDLIHGVGHKSGNIYILPNRINLAGIKHCDPLDGVKVHPETIGQYIGIVGNIEMWEGDIIEIPNLKQDWIAEPKRINWRVFSIKWNRFVWSLNNEHLYMPLREMNAECTYSYEFKKLGNIHDNPNYQP